MIFMCCETHREFFSLIYFSFIGYSTESPETSTTETSTMDYFDLDSTTEDSVNGTDYPDEGDDNSDVGFPGGKAVGPLDLFLVVVPPCCLDPEWCEVSQAMIFEYPLQKC